MSSSSFIILFILISISLFGSSFSSETQDDSKEYVVTLDISNFTGFVSKHKFIAVKFYAPWCGHCKALAPEWEKAAKILSENDPPLILAKVDVTDEKNMKLAETYEIRGLPTVKILRFGGSITQDYRGSREAQGIVDYFKKQSGPATLKIKSPEDAAVIISDKKITIVGVFPEFSGEKFENFTTVAERLRADIDFFHTTDVKLLPRGDTSVSGPIIRLFKPFDELNVDFQEFNADVLTKVVEASSIPLVTTLNKDPDNHVYVTKYFDSPNAKAMLFLNFSSDNFDAFKSKYRDVAEQHKGVVSFLIGDLDEASQGAFKYYGLREEQVPLVIIQTKGKKYLKSNVAPEEIPSLLKDFVDGKLEPYKKSEPIPEVNNEPVKVVVGDNLEDMFFNSGKNVLLEFYAPWCDHCKKLAPILEEVAVSLKDSTDVVIAKMDATANDYPHETFDVKGYPALFFKPTIGNISEYDGGPTKEDIMNFIQKNKGTDAHQDSAKDEL